MRLSKKKNTEQEIKICPPSEMRCFLNGRMAYKEGYYIIDNPEGHRPKAFPIAWAIGWFSAYIEDPKNAEELGK